MPRRSTRVDALPPSPPSLSQGSQLATSTEHAATSSSTNTAFWWGGSRCTGSPAASSAQTPSTDNQFSQATQAEFASPNSDPRNWGKDPSPHGGFVNYLQNASDFPVPQIPHLAPMPPNFHFSNGPAHYVPSAAPRPSVSNGIPSPPVYESSTSHMPPGSQPRQFIDVDNGNEDGEMRTSRRLTWTKEEDIRLMSSWLKNSNDPIRGNNKKNDQYWNDVVVVYNSITPKSRWRSAKQAKDRWHTVNKLIHQFQYSWKKASRIYSSGKSDDQLREKAHAFYEKDWGGQFLLMNVWKSVCDQPKWHNYNKNLEEAKKRKVTYAGETGEHASSPVPIEDQPRPIGTKQAKAERNVKGKAKAVATEMEELHKYEEVQSGIIEKKQQLSTEKLEIAKMAHIAAKENKEARKHDKECEIWRTYRAMATQDTSGMSDSMKDEYTKALKVMRERLFGNSQ